MTIPFWYFAMPFGIGCLIGAVVVAITGYVNEKARHPFG